jgi:hypothetical protein
MSKKFKVRLTEQEFGELLAKSLLDKILGGGFNKDEIKKILSSEVPTKSDVTGGTGAGEFTEVDLNSSEGYNAYKQIADRFISGRSANLLGITGDMLASAAKNTFNKHKKYVPVELALAQLATEGGFSSNPNARPIKTKNPFNVGNVDSGKNVYHSSVQSGIQTYYDLIARRYLTGNKTASDLLKNFVNADNQRYATGGYEDTVRKIAAQAKGMSEPVFASIKKKGSDIA